MLFFFRKPKVIVDCFTENSGAFEFAKPDNAIKFIPDWWKNIPVSYTPENSFFKYPTLKGCDGVINNFKYGVIIPAWCDLAIEIGPKGSDFYRWQFSDSFSELSTHEYIQFNNHIDAREIQHIKLHSPWYFSCKEIMHWIWTDPKWNNIKINNYIVLPGITSFKYQHSTNINLLFYREAQSKIIDIKHRTPLMHMIPLSDKKLILKHHLVSRDEFNKLGLNPGVLTFFNRIKTLKKLRTNKK